MSEFKFKAKYDIGQTVYIVHDTEQNPYMITGYLVSAGTVSYEISKGNEVIYVRAFEIEKDKNIIIN